MAKSNMCKYFIYIWENQEAKAVSIHHVSSVMSRPKLTDSLLAKHKAMVKGAFVTKLGKKILLHTNPRMQEILVYIQDNNLTCHSAKELDETKWEFKGPVHTFDTIREVHICKYLLYKEYSEKGFMVLSL